ncbi:MAG: VOC family protein [Thermoflexales bacterium]
MELDHIVILVEDLDAAQGQWRDAGFNVTPGGAHADGLTHNALICFADGSYIELLAFRAQAVAAHRWDRFRAFPGPIDYAIAVNDLPAFAQQINARGLNYTEAIEGGRQRPDGVTIRWRTSWPPQHAEGLPFLIEDLTPRELRVPQGERRNHPNNAVGIAALTVAVADPDRAARDLATLLGSAAINADEPRAFAIGGAMVRIRHLSEYPALTRRGPGPASFTVALAGGGLWPYPARPQNAKA